MNKLSRFLLRKLIEWNVKTYNQKETISGLYYEIALYLKDNYEPSKTTEYYHYPIPDFVKKSTNMEDFIKECQRDGELRAQYKDCTRFSGC